MKLEKEERKMDRLLGGRIKALRTVKNYTQEQVAEQLGISRQKYARIESGLNSITLVLLTKLADIFDVTVGDKLVTLSTCLGSGKQYRYLVVGVLTASEDI